MNRQANALASLVGANNVKLPLDILERRSWPTVVWLNVGRRPASWVRPWFWSSCWKSNEQSQAWVVWINASNGSRSEEKRIVGWAVKKSQTYLESLYTRAMEQLRLVHSEPTVSPWRTCLTDRRVFARVTLRKSTTHLDSNHGTSLSTSCPTIVSSSPAVCAASTARPKRVHVLKVRSIHIFLENDQS